MRKNLQKKYAAQGLTHLVTDIPQGLKILILMIRNVTVSLLFGILLQRRPLRTRTIALEGAAPPSFFLPLPCLSISRGVNLCATITFDIHTKKIKST